MGRKQYMLVLITTGSFGEAERIAKALVTEKFAACVNIVEKCTSIYRWKGRVVKDDESLLIAKTSRHLFSRLSRRVNELHGYDVPEVIGISLDAVDSGYLGFLEDALGTDH